MRDLSGLEPTCLVSPLLTPHPFPPQVLLIQGLDPKTIEEVEKGSHHGGLHLASALKFVALRLETPEVRHTVLQGLGGAWDQQLDGGDPHE